MILSTFHRLQPFRLYLLIGFLVTECAFLALCAQGHISQEVVPGALVPDMAIMGYSPQEAWKWYGNLNDEGRKAVLQMGLVDIFGIMPSYTLLLGSQLVASGCPPFLCYLPIWTVTFDLMESGTHFAAVLSRHYWKQEPWTPSGFHLVTASASTQAKMIGTAASVLLIAILEVKARFQKQKSKVKTN